MPRLSKRCRLLVSVLLVCGFCLSFSSVSFAADAFRGSRISSSSSANGVNYRVVASSSDPWVEFETVSSISASTAYTMYRGYIKDYYTVTLENTNDFPTYLSSGEEMYLQAYCANPGYGSYFGTDNGYTISIDDTLGCHISSVGISQYGGNPSSQVFFYLDDSHYHNGNLVLLPYETVTVSFTAIREYSVYASDNSNSLHSEKTLIQNGLQSAYINSVTVFNVPTATYTGFGSQSPSFVTGNGISSIRKSIYDPSQTEIGSFVFNYSNGYTHDVVTTVSNGVAYDKGLFTVPGDFFFYNGTSSVIEVLNGSFTGSYFDFSLSPSLELSSPISITPVSFEASSPNFFGSFYSNSFGIYLGGDKTLNNRFLISPYSYYSSSFSITFEYSLSRPAYSSSNYSLSFALNNLTPFTELNGGFRGYLSSAVSSDSTTNALTGQLQQQQQQQQQQHEEQMQQSQEQYEDFTDPDTQGGSDLITGTEDEIEGKIGIFTFIDNLIQRFLGLFTISDASTALTLPAFTMEIQGETYQIWNEYTFDLSSLDGPFNVLITAVRFATVATVYFAFLSYLQKTYNRIIGGHDG